MDPENLGSIQDPFRFYLGFQVSFRFHSGSILFRFHFWSIQDFRVHSDSIGDPLRFHWGSIQVPFTISGSIQVPFTISGSIQVHSRFQGPFRFHLGSIQIHSGFQSSFRIHSGSIWDLRLHSGSIQGPCCLSLTVPPTYRTV